MAQTLRLTAFAAAAAIALLAGPSFGLAQEKERMGIDNDNSCDRSMRDPDCHNDLAKNDIKHFMPFAGERDQFYKDKEVIHRRHRHRLESQG